MNYDSRRFLPLFNESSGVSLSIDRVRSNPTHPNIVTVASRVQRGQGEAVRTEWRLRERGGRYRIVDVVAEGDGIVRRPVPAKSRRRICHT